MKTHKQQFQTRDLQIYSSLQYDKLEITIIKKANLATLNAFKIIPIRISISCNFVIK